MSRRSLPLKRPSDSVTKSDVRKGRVSSIFDARKMDAMDASLGGGGSRGFPRPFEREAGRGATRWKLTLPQDRRLR